MKNYLESDLIPLFFVVWRPGLPIPHKFGIDVDGYMISITHYFRKKCEDLHKSLDFNGPIVVDSGAYTFGKKGKFPNTSEVFEHQIALGADIIVPLDYPLLYASKGQYNDFIEKTLENNALWLKLAEKFNVDVLGVIQGDSTNLKGILKRIESPYLGLGGKAIRPSNGSIYSRSKLLDEIRKIRSIIGDKKRLHMLGFSGISTYPKFAPFIDSFDSLAAQMYAAYGTILTDNPSFRKPKWTRNQSKAIEDVLSCLCPICQENGETVLDSTRQSEKFRFLHNVWWLQKYYDKNSKTKQTFLNIPGIC